MPSPESDALRRMFESMSARMAADPTMDLETLREMVEQLHTLSAEPLGVTYEEVTVGGLAALWCRPREPLADRVVLFFHGGGFVTNSVASHHKLAGHVARATGVSVLSVDYRRAPEHRFPAQIEDAVTAYEWVLREGFAAERVGVVGDSAGGGLATSLVLRLRDLGRALPAAVVGFSPWFDMEASGKTLETNAHTDAFAQRPVVENMVAMYLGDASRTDPLANPLYAEPTALPPFYFTVSDHEALQDNAERFAARVEAAGGEVVVELTSGMQHEWVVMAGRAPEADETIEHAAGWLRGKLSPGAE